jgi:phosphatidylinositol alpha-mannosyltransferase
VRGDVVYVVPYFPPDLGGVERMAEQLAMRVAARRKVTVLTSSSGQPHQIPPEYPPTMEVRRLRTFRVAQIPFMPRLASELLRTPRGSIVHVHVSQAYAPEVVWLVSRLTRRPFVAHFHLDVAPSTRLGPMFLLYKKVVLARVLRAATRVVVLSREQAQLIENTYRVRTRRISVIPNGVSPEFLTIVRRPDLRQGPLRLLFVGRLSPQKNVPRLLEALAQVHSDVELAIVGSGPDEGDIEARIRLMGLENVRMVGAQHGAALHDWYGWADALVLTSEQEGMPLVLLEAMAAGLPIVATDVAGVRATVGDAALVAEPTAEGVAAAVDRLASEPELRDELSDRGRERVRAFEWDRVVDAIENVYRAVAG